MPIVEPLTAFSSPRPHRSVWRPSLRGTPGGVPELGSTTGTVGATSAFGTVGEVYPGFARSTESRTVEGVRFSFSVPRSGWENGPHQRIGGRFRNSGLLIGKSTVGGQAAEAVIFWTGFRDGGLATPCAKLLSSAVGGSSADLATAVGEGARDHAR